MGSLRRHWESSRVTTVLSLKLVQQPDHGRWSQIHRQHPGRVQRPHAPEVSGVGVVGSLAVSPGHPSLFKQRINVTTKSSHPKPSSACPGALLVRLGDLCVQVSWLPVGSMTCGPGSLWEGPLTIGAGGGKAPAATHLEVFFPPKEVPPCLSPFRLL